MSIFDHRESDCYPYRLATPDAVRLIEEEVFARMSVHDLPPADRLLLFRAALQDGMRVETPVEFLAGIKKSRA